MFRKKKNPFQELLLKNCDPLYEENKIIDARNRMMWITKILFVLSVLFFIINIIV